MLSDLVIRLRSFLRPRTVESELDAELNFHYSRLTEQFIAAGMAPEEARRRANIELGGLEQTKEDCRQARGISFVEHLVRDLGYAGRMFVKSPGFSAAVVLSLALGIGANTAVFSLINALMWRQVPVKDPETLLLVGRGNVSYTFTYPQFRTMRRDNDVMTDLAAYSPVRLNVSIDGSIEPTADGQMVSGSYFSILGVNPVIGRPIGDEDDAAINAHPVAMISHSYWKRRFDSQPSAVGKTIALSGAPFTIIGVTPPEFAGLEVGMAPEIFVPVMMQPALMQAQENLLVDEPTLYHTWLRVFGRARPGVTTAHAAGALDPLFRQEIPAGGKFDLARRQAIVLRSAATGVSDLREPFSQSLFILMAVVVTVLMIACANIANLLLARAAARRPEFAMRLALGAGRRRLIGQLLVESALLALVGGMCGIAVAHWAARSLVNFLSAGRTPIALDVSPDVRVLAFTVVASMATGILFGLAPALRAVRADLTPALNSGGGRGATGSRHRLRADRALAVAQVALSLTLLIGAGLFVRSLHQLNARDAGIDRDRVLIVRVEPKGSDQRGPEGVSGRLDRTYRSLIQQVESIPGVEVASMAQFTPMLARANGQSVELPGGKELEVLIPMIYPKYFSTVGIAMLAGRDFNDGDLADQAPKVTIVNEAFVRLAFPNEQPVGRRVKVGSEEREIIGVVKDSPYLDLRRDIPAIAYQTFLQTNTGRGQMVLHARVRGNVAAVTQQIREQVQRLDPTLPTFEVHTLSDEIDAALVRERLIATLSSVFGVLALALACVGLYGLLAFTIAQRTTEMGVRMALGARRVDVVMMVMREALTLVGAGTVLGLIGAMATTRLASNQISVLLFRTNVTDLATIVVATLILGGVASLASYLPARRASRVEPMMALRNE
jgi:predicted permease